MQLAPSAVAADGSGAAAATAVPGGNRARVREGVALFKDVRVVAERPGTFLLTAKTASRKARSHSTAPHSQDRCSDWKQGCTHVAHEACTAHERIPAGRSRATQRSRWSWRRATR